MKRSARFAKTAKASCSVDRCSLLSETQAGSSARDSVVS